MGTNDYEIGQQARKDGLGPFDNPHFAMDPTRFDAWSDGWIYQDIAEKGRKALHYADVRSFMKRKKIFGGTYTRGLTASWGQK